MGLAENIKEELTNAYMEGYRDGVKKGKVDSNWYFFVAGVAVAFSVDTLIKIIFL